MNYFFQNFIDTIQNASFKGSATRTQYWLFTLAEILIYVLIVIMFFLTIVWETHFTQPNAPTIPVFFKILLVITAILFYVYPFVILIQTWAITARRLHDANLSGWWQLIGFIPLIGNIILFILLVLPSRNENNRFNLLPEQK